MTIAQTSPTARGVDRWAWGDEAVWGLVQAQQSTILVACYAALCRLASGQQTRDAFEVPIPALARAMGAKDVKSARAAFWKLAALKVITVKERKVGRGQNLPHLVWLVEGEQFSRAEGGSPGGSTPDDRLGREATGDGSPNDRGSVVSREDRGSPNGRRSEEGRNQNHHEEEHPLSPPRANELDLRLLRRDGTLGAGASDLWMRSGDVLKADSSALSAAVARWAQRRLPRRKGDTPDTQGTWVGAKPSDVRQAIWDVLASDEQYKSNPVVTVAAIRDRLYEKGIWCPA